MAANKCIISPSLHIRHAYPGNMGRIVSILALVHVPPVMMEGMELELVYLVSMTGLGHIATLLLPQSCFLLNLTQMVCSAYSIWSCCHLQFYSATFIYVDFNKVTNSTLSSFDCSFILDSSSMDILGSTTCMWVNSTRLQIPVPLVASIQIGSSIGVNPGKIFSGIGNSYSTNGSVVVQAPPNPTIPIATIVGPSVSMCENIVSYHLATFFFCCC